MRNDTINKTIQYQCTGSNGVENPATDVANVTVHCKSVLQLFCCYCCYFSFENKSCQDGTTVYFLQYIMLWSFYVIELRPYIRG